MIFNILINQKRHRTGFFPFITVAAKQKYQRLSAFQEHRRCNNFISRGEDTICIHSVFMHTCVKKFLQ